jgi:hypothetical protein
LYAKWKKLPWFPIAKLDNVYRGEEKNRSTTIVQIFYEIRLDPVGLEFREFNMTSPNLERPKREMGVVF